MRCSWVYLVYGSNNSYYKLQISEIAKVYTAIGCRNGATAVWSVHLRPSPVSDAFLGDPLFSLELHYKLERSSTSKGRHGCLTAIPVPSRRSRPAPAASLSTAAAGLVCSFAHSHLKPLHEAAW